MLSYTHLQTKPRIFRSLSGLSLKEFDHLLPTFDQAWQAHVANEYIHRDGRKRRYGGGRKAELIDSGDKLLFILFYFRHYPTQEVQGFLVIAQPSSQSVCCEVRAREMASKAAMP